MTSDKNAILSSTARVCRKQGVQKLVAVCPIEHDLYYTEDQTNPAEKKLDFQRDALSVFAPTNIINTNLVYGEGSYLLHYMTQCAMVGKIPYSLGREGRYEFTPVHTDDIVNSIEHSLANPDQVKQTNLTLNGCEDLTLKEILYTLEQSVSKDQGATTPRKTLLGLGISDYIEEFFVGITHDKNMARLADFFEQHPNINLKDNDFYGKFNMQNK